MKDITFVIGFIVFTSSIYLLCWRCIFPAWTPLGEIGGVGVAVAQFLFILWELKENQMKKMKWCMLLSPVVLCILSIVIVSSFKPDHVNAQQPSKPQQGAEEGGIIIGDIFGDNNHVESNKNSKNEIKSDDGVVVVGDKNKVQVKKTSNTNFGAIFQFNYNGTDYRSVTQDKNFNATSNADNETNKTAKFEPLHNDTDYIIDISKTRAASLPAGWKGSNSVLVGAINNQNTVKCNEYEGEFQISVNEQFKQSGNFLVKCELIGKDNHRKDFSITLIDENGLEITLRNNIIGITWMSSFSQPNRNQRHVAPTSTGSGLISIIRIDEGFIARIPGSSNTGDDIVMRNPDFGTLANIRFTFKNTDTLGIAKLSVQKLVSEN